jgi:hypothetical protein
MRRWRFLVVRDPKIKETVGALYLTVPGAIRSDHGIVLAILVLA